jgi:hypothetical protein
LMLALKLSSTLTSLKARDSSSTSGPTTLYSFSMNPANRSAFVFSSLFSILTSSRQLVRI